MYEHDNSNNCLPAKLAQWSWAQSNYENLSPPNPRPGKDDNNSKHDNDVDNDDDDDGSEDADQTSIVVSVTRLPAVWEYLASPKLCFPLPSGLREIAFVTLFPQFSIDYMISEKIVPDICNFSTYI